MSIQRTRPIETLQSILSSLKQFEKKLEKLQDDVTYHGHSLSELHIMLANMTGSNILSDFNNDKLEDVNKLVHKTTAMRHDSNFYHEKPFETKRKNLIQSLPSKLTNKSLQCQRKRINPTKETYSDTTKIPANTKYVLSGKRILRQKKGEAFRKVPRLKKDSKNKI